MHCASKRQSSPHPHPIHPSPLMLLPPAAPPTRRGGKMPHPPGACCPHAVCRSSLSASPWRLLAGTNGSERVQAPVSSLYPRRSPPPKTHPSPPPAAHPPPQLKKHGSPGPGIDTQLGQPGRACLLIMWYPSDSQRGAGGIPVRSSVGIGQQDPL